MGLRFGLISRRIMTSTIPGHDAPPERTAVPSNFASEPGIPAAEKPPVGNPPAHPIVDRSGDAAFLDDFLEKSASAMSRFAQEPSFAERMVEIADAITMSLASGGKLMVAGNGGSAADAQHISGEFTARLMYDRRPLAAVALTTDSSGMTAISNDYGYEHVFSRQILALGRPGDVFLGITTSGRSPNIRRAFAAARAVGLVTIALLGEGEGGLDDCDLVLRAPSGWTPIVQQIHITAAHIICGLVERHLCPPGIA